MEKNLIQFITAFNRFPMKKFKINKNEFIKAIFNPNDHDSFIILNKTSIQYCEVKAHFDVKAETEEDPQKIYSIESKYVPHLLNFKLEKVSKL